MNLFGGKKSELDNKIEQFKLLFNQEFDQAELALEGMKDWVRLEVDYARELMFIKNKLEKIPSKF